MLAKAPGTRGYMLYIKIYGDPGQPYHHFVTALWLLLYTCLAVFDVTGDGVGIGCYDFAVL